jgi:hypothetical protein
LKREVRKGKGGERSIEKESWERGRGEEEALEER